MNYEDIRKWCHGEMRALPDSPMHARGRAILALIDADEAHPWLADAAEALGKVRPDGAPLALNLTQVLTAIRELRAELGNSAPIDPIPMRLTCPSCGELHVDEGEFATKSHHTHACQECGMVWRPAIVATVGVRFLTGFKDVVGDVVEDDE